MNPKFPHALFRPTSIAFVAILMLAPAVTCVGQETSRADFKEFCKAIEGRWIGSMTLVSDHTFGKEGDKLTTHFSSTMSADGHILLGTYHAGEGTGNWICFYDPGAKQIKVLSVNSAGDCKESVVSREDGKWTERSKGSMADGQPTSKVDVLTISDGGDTHTWVDTGTIAGEKYAARTTVWKRVHK